MLTKSILKLPKRKKASHKGDFGRVLVVAGSEEYAGAAGLCSLAAMSVLKVGVDLVTVAAPEKVAWILNAVSLSLITRKMKGTHFAPAHAEEILSLQKKFDALLIGPGIGRKSDTFCRKVCLAWKGLKVIDADAIRALGRDHAKVRNAVFTPHSKEFEYMTGKDIAQLPTRQKTKILQSAAGDNVILFKGNADIIATKNHAALNKTGNPSMTRGGTGDVLAGLTAGFLTLTRDRFKAACMGAYLNGAIGDYLYRQYGNTWLTEDMLKYVQLFHR